MCLRKQEDAHDPLMQCTITSLPANLPASSDKDMSLNDSQQFEGECLSRKVCSETTLHG